MRTNLTVSAVKIIYEVSRNTLLVAPSIKNDLGIDTCLSWFLSFLLHTLSGIGFQF